MAGYQAMTSSPIKLLMIIWMTAAKSAVINNINRITFESVSVPVSG